jgi:hypothetical protein
MKGEQSNMAIYKNLRCGEVLRNLRRILAITLSLLIVINMLLLGASAENDGLENGSYLVPLSFTSGAFFLPHITTIPLFSSSIAVKQLLLMTERFCESVIQGMKLHCPIPRTACMT